MNGGVCQNPRMLEVTMLSSFLSGSVSFLQLVILGSGRYLTARDVLQELGGGGGKLGFNKFWPKFFFLNINSSVNFKSN